MIEIKKIEPGNVNILNTDLSDLIDDWNCSFSFTYIEKLVSDDRSYFFVAVLDNTIVGYCLAYRFPSLNSSDGLAYLYDIEVLETHRRKGIGKKLIENILTFLKMDGVTELWLGTATDNHPAQSLFISTGAERSKEAFYDYTYNL